MNAETSELQLREEIVCLRVQLEDAGCRVVSLRVFNDRAVRLVPPLSRKRGHRRTTQIQVESVIVRTTSDARLRRSPRMLPDISLRRMALDANRRPDRHTCLLICIVAGLLLRDPRRCNVLEVLLNYVANCAVTLMVLRSQLNQAGISLGVAFVDRFPFACWGPFFCGIRSGHGLESTVWHASRFMIEIILKPGWLRERYPSLEARHRLDWLLMCSLDRLVANIPRLVQEMHETPLVLQREFPPRTDWWGNCMGRVVHPCNACLKILFVL